LHRERGDLFGRLADLDIEAERRVEQPVELPFRRTEPVLALPHAKHRAVVEHVPGIVAPHAVGHTIGLELGDIARDQAVEIAHRVPAGDAVLHHGSQIVEGRGIADREVLLLDRGEHIDRGVPGPGDEAVDLAQRPRALVKGSLEQRLDKMGSGIVHIHAASRTCRAAFRPAVPITPPPGWQPAPQR